MNNFLIICEQRDGVLHPVSNELIGKAKSLATGEQKVIALLMGHNVKGLAQGLVDHGADKVIVADHELLADYITETYTKATAAAIANEKPDFALIGATTIGRDLAPRVGARVKTGLTADCTTLEVDPESGELLMTRPAFGGNLMATIVCPNHRPQMATVRPGVMIALKPEPRTGIIEDLNIEFTSADANVEILETVKTKKEAVDITQASVLVSGGRGMANSFDSLKDLAAVIGGEVAASRVLVDVEVADKNMQVGQTGKTVRPDVYIAAGISGAVQHTAGMEESTLIIAINKDEGAPIFGVADLGIVGDASKIIPKLTEKLKK